MWEIYPQFLTKNDPMWLDQDIDDKAKVMYW